MVTFSIRYFFNNLLKAFQMGNPRVPLTFDTCYHIYNFSVGSEYLFRERRNYPHFLEKLQKWITPVAEIIEWSLVPDQFHLYIKIRSRQEIALFFGIELPDKRHVKTLKKIDKYLARKISYQFAHCFNSYAQSFNKTYHRKGALFRESFFRTVIHPSKLGEILNFIFMTPVRCGLVTNADLWNYSSFTDSYKYFESKNATSSPNLVNHSKQGKKQKGLVEIDRIRKKESITPLPTPGVPRAVHHRYNQ
jgi:hypothetical protein